MSNRAGLPAAAVDELAAPRRALRAIKVLSLVHLIGLPVALAQQAMMAYYFGARAEMDVFTAAGALPGLVVSFVQGNFVVLLTPDIVRARQESEARARHLCSGAMLALLAATVVLAALLPMVTDLALTLSAPGFTAERRALFESLFPLTALSILLGLLAAVSGDLLNAAHKYGTQSVTSLAGRIVTFAILPIAIPLVGVRALPLSTLGGALVNTLGNLVLLRRAGLLGIPRRGIGWRAIARRWGTALVPLSLFRVIDYGTRMAGGAIASFAPVGVIAVFGYASRLYAILEGLLRGPVASGIFPTYSEHAAKSDRAGMGKSMGSALLCIGIGSVVLAAFLYILAGPIVSAVFQAGRFDRETSIAVGSALAILALGLPGTGANNVVGFALWALKRYWHLVFTCSLWAVSYLVPLYLTIDRLGASALALAGTISYLVHSLVMLLVLRRMRINPSLPNGAPNRGFVVAGGGLVVLAIVFCTAVGLAVGGGSHRLVLLGVLGLAAALVYLPIAMLMSAWANPERRPAFAALLRRLDAALSR